MSSAPSETRAEELARFRARLVGKLPLAMRRWALALIDRFSPPDLVEGPATRAIADQLLAAANSEQQAIAMLVAWITQNFDITPPTADSRYQDDPEAGTDRLRAARIDAAVALRTGECGWRDYALRRVAVRLGMSPLDLHRIALYQLPVQLNHTASEVRIRDRRMFVDATFGVYFTDMEDRPLSFSEARRRFPAVHVHQLDTDRGHRLTHGTEGGLGDYQWRCWSGEDLMRQRIPNWYLSTSPDGIPWCNADLLRTYFTSASSSDTPRIQRALAVCGGSELDVESTHHAEPGLIGIEEHTDVMFGYDVRVVDAPRQLRIELVGSNLDQVLVNWNDDRMDELEFGTFEATEIDSAVESAGEEQLRQLTMNSSGNGTLVLMPTAAANARLLRIRVADIHQ